MENFNRATEEVVNVRKILVGKSKDDCLAFVVGNPITVNGEGFTVSEIYLDDNRAIIHGSTPMYFIYLKDTNGLERKWKAFYENQVYAIEFFI